MKKFGLRHQCAFGALAISLAIAPATAQAQDATTADTDEADLIDNADVDTGPVIIVRAQGREQALTDVPVAVSAISGEVLEKSGVTDIRDLNQVAPSLLVSSTGNESRQIGFNSLRLPRLDAASRQMVMCSLAGCFPVRIETRVGVQTGLAE